MTFISKVHLSSSVKQASKEAVNAVKKCESSFSKCRKYEDDVGFIMYACMWVDFILFWANLLNPGNLLIPGHTS